MDIDVWFRLILFAAAGFLTPGPNTMMAFASGVNFGFRRTIPHIAGVMTGTLVIFLAVGGGLVALLELYPSLRLMVQGIGLLYLLYLAFKIATAAGLTKAKAGQPITYFQAIAVQALNVKLMGVAAGVSLNYQPIDDTFLNLLIVALTASLINGPCVSSWCLFGTRLQHFLQTGWRLRLFNIFLALLIVATLLPVVGEIWRDSAELIG